MNKKKKKIVAKTPTKASVKTRGKSDASDDFSPKKAFKRTDSVLWRKNPNGSLVLLRMDAAGFFYRLDGLSAELWLCFQKPRTAEALVEYLCKQYPKSRKQIDADVTKFVKKLIQLKMLAGSDVQPSAAFPAPQNPFPANYKFSGIESFDLEKIETEVLNESIYLDVFAGSDRQLKTSVTPIKGALQKVLQLDGINYRWDSKKIPAKIKVNTKATRAGLIAQQVALLMPELVRADKATGFLAVEYQQLTSYLVESIKDLHRIVLSQEQRIKKLEQKR